MGKDKKKMRREEKGRERSERQEQRNIDKNPVSQTAQEVIRESMKNAPDYGNATFTSANIPPGQHSLVGARGFTDPTDGYANDKNLYICITGVASGKDVKFKGFITEFTDTFTANWNKEELIQRNDIIATYKNTLRTISLGWSVPAADMAQAKVNLENTSMLTKMLYGKYETLGGTGNTVSLTAPPLIKVRFTNLVSGEGTNPLYLVVSTISFSPDLDAGFFDPGQNLLPKSWELSLEGDVLHEEQLGWSGATWRGGSSFPFLPNEGGENAYKADKDFREADVEAATLRSIADVQEQEAQKAAESTQATGEDTAKAKAKEQANQDLENVQEKEAAAAQVIYVQKS